MSPRPPEPPAALLFPGAARDALVQAVTVQWDGLVRRVMVRTRLSRADAEDVLSEVTVRVLAKGVSADVEDWFHYLATAAGNRAADAQRNEARAQARAARSPAASWIDAVPVADVAEAAVARLDLAAAFDALDALPQETAHVFLLRALEGLSVEAIAERTGLTERQVRRRLDKARATLHKVQQERRATEGFALLAALLDRARAARATAPATGGPAAASVIGGSMVSVLSVLSLIAVVAVPLPRLLRSDPPAVPAERTVAPGRGDRTGAPARTGREAGDAIGTAVQGVPGRDGVLPRPGAATANRALRVAVGICAPGACAITEPPRQRPRGDVVRVARLDDDPYVHQDVTPVCWAVPDNAVVRCSSDDPEAYRVPRQDPGRPGGKSQPSAPAPWEPWKEARP